MGWREAAELITVALEKTISQKIVTYDLARQMKGAKEARTSEFASAIIRNL
jgi:isocitrate dehydrogenase